VPPELAGFAAQNQAWLRIYRLPAYTKTGLTSEPVPSR
jgi:hypothetical protein